MSLLPPMTSDDKTLGQLLDCDTTDQTAGMVLTSLGNNAGYDLQVAGATLPHNEISQLDSSVIVTDTGPGNGLVSTTTDGTLETTVNGALGLDLVTAKLSISGAGGAAGQVPTATGVGSAVAWTHVTGDLGFAEPNDKLVVGSLAGRYDHNGTFYGFKIYGGQNFDRGTITVYGIRK